MTSLGCRLFAEQLNFCGISNLWNAFVQAHAAAQLAGVIEIQMEYFTRAIETVLNSGPDWDGIGLELGPAHWERAVRESGYVAAQQTVRQTA